MKYFQKSILLFLLVISIVNASVSIKSMSGHPTPDVISMRPYIELINESDEIIELSEIVIDYYLFEEELSAEDLTWEAYWNNEDLHYEMNFFNLPETVENNGLKANIKCQISFTASATSLSAGASLKMQHGIFKSGWNYTFDERDDWSFSLNSMYSYNEHIVVTNHITGEVLFGNSIEENTTPRPYSVVVNWLGERTFNELKDVKIKEGDAILNSTDKISYIYYQDKWTLLSEVNTDLSNYATKTYVDNAVVIAPNSISANQISKNHLTNVNADLLDGLHANEIIEAASGSTGGIDAEAKGYLKSIDEKLSVLISLQYQNSTNPIPEGINIDDYYAVRKILDVNNLYHIPVGSIVNFDQTSGKVESLMLGDKGINILPSDIGQLSEIEYMDLHKNNLVSLPDEIGQLKNLSVLVLHENRLSTIPTTIGNLIKLEAIYLTNNMLTALPDGIGQLERLSFLELSYNQLTYLPNNFCNLTSLYNLRLNNNLLIELPENIGNLTDLRYLLLNNNELRSLPESITNLTKFPPVGPYWSNEFNIHENRICSISDNVREWLNTYAMNWEAGQNCD